MSLAKDIDDNVEAHFDRLTGDPQPPRPPPAPIHLLHTERAAHVARDTENRRIALQCAARVYQGDAAITLKETLHTAEMFRRFLEGEGPNEL